MSHRMMSAAALAVAFVVATVQPSFADMSRPVIAAFKGQLIISKGELPVGKNDKDTIAHVTLLTIGTGDPEIAVVVSRLPTPK